MRVIVTVDDAYGVAFNQRRQSRDRILCADILSSLCGTDTLVLSPYSLPLFNTSESKIRISHNPSCDLSDNEITFLERTSILPFIDRITELTVYHWNRRYPQDVALGVVPSDAGFVLYERTEFVGSSHDKITKEIYRR